FEYGKMEGGEAGGVGDDLGGDDACVGVAEGEGENSVELAVRSEDEAWRAVDERHMECGIAGELRVGDGAAGPGLRSNEGGGCAGACGARVKRDDDVRSKDGHEAVEVAGAKCGEEGADGFALLSEGVSGGG